MKSLKAIRKHKKIKQKVAAEALGVTVRTLVNYENGSRKLPIGYVTKLSELYEVPVEEIVRGAEEVM